MNTTPLAIIFFCTATLILALSIPLFLGKVPMNHFYGVRFRQSFKSDQNWYEINRYGAKVMALFTIPIYIAASIGVLFATFLADYSSIYSMGTAVITCLSICAAVLITAKEAKRIDEKNEG